MRQFASLASLLPSPISVLDFGAAAVSRDSSEGGAAAGEKKATFSEIHSNPGNRALSSSWTSKHLVAMTRSFLDFVAGSWTTAKLRTTLICGTHGKSVRRRGEKRGLEGMHSNFESGESNPVFLRNYIGNSPPWVGELFWISADSGGRKGQNVGRCCKSDVMVCG
ncbi:hypothetical protein C8R43DRAFT_954395 [Mycena crocata]|nr:hypothetical protein C8R43DRAFT_954395 [Mycena crocata]